MELKKNPNVDPKRNSTLYFLVGLTAILALTYVGIELKTLDPVVKTDTFEVSDNMSMKDEEVIITIPLSATAPPPPPPAPVEIEVIRNEVIIEKEKKIEKTEVIPDKPTEVVSSSAIGDPSDDEFDVPDELPFSVIEDIPMFPGCEKVQKSKRAECFQIELAKLITKYFEYPIRARENNVQNKVYVNFMIDKEGNFTEIKVRGAKKVNGGEMLEDEAKRIFNKMPKITPGKQRGKPVKVRYTYPINFTLTN